MPLKKLEKNLKILRFICTNLNENVFFNIFIHVYYINDSSNLTSAMFITYNYIFYNNCHVIKKSHVISVLSPLLIAAVCRCKFQIVCLLHAKITDKS